MKYYYILMIILFDWVVNICSKGFIVFYDLEYETLKSET